MVRFQEVLSIAYVSACIGSGYAARTRLRAPPEIWLTTTRSEIDISIVQKLVDMIVDRVMVGFLG